VTDEADESNDGGPFPIDFNAPRLARIENFISGGEANFSVDRTVAEDLAEATPNSLEGLRAVIEGMQAFVARGVHAVVDESDVRQFLHIGMATPTTGMIHELVLPAVPDARVVYASYDPTTLAHVHTLFKDVPEGAVAHVHSQFDDPGRILRGAAATLDLDQPIAVVLPTSLNIVTDEAAQRLMDALRDALAPGSYLVLAHTSLDIEADGTAEVIDLLNQALEETYVARTEAEIAHLVEGYDLLDPGLVPIERWRSAGDPPYLPRGQLIPLYGVVGCKPG
jgi:hypothetical protein